jgi:hypothetical protein
MFDCLLNQPKSDLALLSQFSFSGVHLFLREVVDFEPLNNVPLAVLAGARKRVHQTILHAVGVT